MVIKLYMNWKDRVNGLTKTVGEEWSGGRKNKELEAHLSSLVHKMK